MRAPAAILYPSAAVLLAHLDSRASRAVIAVEQRARALLLQLPLLLADLRRLLRGDVGVLLERDVVEKGV